MSDLFCLRHCCRRAGLQPHEVLARKALRPERAKIIDAHYDAPGLAGHLRAHEGRHRESGHVGRPGQREEPQFGAGPLARGDGPELEGVQQPEAIVFEARQSKTVFLFTKGQDGQWKAESLAMEDWKPSACPYLKNTSNWYLVDAFQADNPIMLAAKTVLACSPERDHYSKFIKDGGCCFLLNRGRNLSSKWH